MLIERSERGGERRKEWNGREKWERRGREEKVHVSGREKERGKIRGRGKENEREYSSLEWGIVRGVPRGGAKVTAKQAAVRRTERARG